MRLKLQTPALFEAIHKLYHAEHRVLLIPLGGGDLINANSEYELNELKRICPEIEVLIDSEKASPSAPQIGDRQKFATNCRRLGFNVHILERRAFENYLTEAAIRKVKGNKYKALEPFQLLKEADHGWSKRDNWRIASAMTVEDLHGTDLGDFLKSCAGKQER